MDEKIKKLLEFIRDNQDVDYDRLTPEYGWYLITVMQIKFRACK